MTTGKILGIAYNVIPVTNVEQSAAWFVNHFGFNIRQPREGYISLFRDNRPILDLIESDHESRAVFQVKQKKRWVITFFTDDIVKLHTELTASQVRVGKVSDEGKYGKFFTFEDLDGNLFDVWEHHDCELVY
ncbi:MULTISPECIES: VOC family protein [unclassified Paenibacillus]|uniref:VOC family protein n=1 Tax=unclassified Paenibacillus TaxID=185978 RepID=UPI0009A6ED35|nr:MULTISPECIES: VOC family protein [unclassified Paenibacillus]SLJ90327.1 Glyoxalase/Bleomycin resistance protein/Dioxygenase superfamily protein [Paenibacillus sp. RU5A]SOC59034.1 Glyoxalase/Bleomycin resistance protein/Dioxygenase superfamily protein [Paenibacillus sp. RU26A]SOC68085.1 Glyoxalase/Bleomycin resistance protein/Dioxygenase superfamily protein [Paenibacillus sp. RU5M]